MPCCAAQALVSYYKCCFFNTGHAVLLYCSGLQQVVEFESLGIKVRNTKRFFVLNPTGLSYEFFWRPIGATALDAASPFACTTKRCVRGAGRWLDGWAGGAVVAGVLCMVCADASK